MKEVMKDFHTHFSKCSENSICSIDITETKNLSLIKYPFTFGLHPWWLKSEKNSDDFMRIVQEIISGKYGTETADNFLGIGECGLDRLKGAEWGLQKRILAQVAEFSCEHNLPLVLHCVKAYPEILALRKSVKCDTDWAVHGFNGNLVEAKKLVEKNIKLSFGGRLLTSEKLRRIFSEIPLSMIFLETDDSDVSIRELYELGAELRKMNFSDFSSQIYRNIFNFFAIS